MDLVVPHCGKLGRNVGRRRTERKLDEGTRSYNMIRTNNSRERPVRECYRTINIGDSSRNDTGDVVQQPWS